MYARTVTAALVPGKADEATKVFEDQIVPMVQSQAGSIRVTLLIDRVNNQAMTISLWESAEAASSTGEGSAYMQEAIGKLRGLVVPKSVEQWEAISGFSAAG
jgi:quinol monooxygenase YgiN